MNIIAIAGNATCGKDTLYRVLYNELEAVTKVKRIAFADALKDDVREFLLDKTGIDSFTEKTEEKEKRCCKPKMTAFETVRQCS